MVWCIEHAEAGEEIVDCIAESLSILQTPLTKKVARLYLISDILHNCSVKGVPNVSYYRLGFQSKLPEIFQDLNQCYSNIESRIRAEAFKQRVVNCFKAWEDWALYPQDFLIKLQNIFMGFVGKIEDSKMESEEEDDDVDGLPLDGAALLKTAAQKGSGTPATPALSRQRKDESDDDSDVDGVPLEPKRPQMASSKAAAPPGFVPSKWETVDPDEVQAQAVTSKWDIFDQDDQAQNEDEDIDGEPLQDDSFDPEVLRQRLREVEVKVMVYQDDLESGKERLRPGWTLSDQVEHYRRKLTKKARESGLDPDNTERTPTGLAGQYGTPNRGYDSDQESGRSRSKKKKSRRRSSSSSRSRSRSRSRDRKSKRSRRSRSRSRSRSPSSSSKRSKKRSRY